MLTEIYIEALLADRPITLPTRVPLPYIKCDEV